MLDTYDASLRATESHGLQRRALHLRGQLGAERPQGLLLSVHSSGVLLGEACIFQYWDVQAKVNGTEWPEGQRLRFSKLMWLARGDDPAAFGCRVLERSTTNCTACGYEGVLIKSPRFMSVSTVAQCSSGECVACLKSLSITWLRRGLHRATALHELGRGSECTFKRSSFRSTSMGWSKQGFQLRSQSQQQIKRFAGRWA